MTSREQFEEWCTKRGLSTDTDSDCFGQQKYKYDRIQCMWEGWQASREAVEVNPPKFVDSREALSKGFTVDYSKGFGDGMDAYEESIRAAGIKVKGE